MAWPLSQDYNEAVQSPGLSFADPELKAGEPALTALGLPRPRSGNFADVYEIDCPASGSKWAVKCFTREVRDLRERYAEISRFLSGAGLPFAVEFVYLEQGVRVQGAWYPALKMRWVEGLLLNDVVRLSADKPARLRALGQIWARMAVWMRESGAAHGDLQHGNVLLVPGSAANSLAIKLIDYDGMFVPSLASRPSGEVGHPNYQHPWRLRDGGYDADVDRVPLLVVATALQALTVGGRDMWERYDNGDNLLFKEADLRDPIRSPLFAELMRCGDGETVNRAKKLVSALRQGPKACALLEVAEPVRVPPPRLPPLPLTPGRPVPAWVEGAVEAESPRPEPFAFDEPSERRGREAPLIGDRPRRPSGPSAPVVIAALMIGVVVVFGAGLVSLRWAESGTTGAKQPPKPPAEGDPKPEKERAEIDKADKGAALDGEKAAGGEQPVPKPKDGRPVGESTRFAVRSSPENGWELSGDGVIGVSGAVKSPWLVFGEIGWKDYDFSVEVRRLKGSGHCGLHFHCSESSEHHVCFGIKAKGGDAAVAVLSSKIDGKSSSSANHPFAEYEEGVPRVLRAKVRGKDLTVYDGETVVMREVIGRPTSGCVGLHVDDATFEFRNITVTPLMGPALLGLPNLRGGK